MHPIMINPNIPDIVQAMDKLLSRLISFAGNSTKTRFKMPGINMLEPILWVQGIDYFRETTSGSQFKKIWKSWVKEIPKKPAHPGPILWGSSGN